ncbi:MAG: uracil-DNA glycosylase, partial [Archangium sp.]
MSEAPDTSHELSEVLEDLRRHLLWQEEDGGRLLLVDARLAAELRGSALARLRTQAAKAAPSPDAQPPAPAPQPAPAARPVAPRATPPEAERPLAARTPPPARREGAPEKLLEVPPQARPYAGPLPGVV